MIYNINDLQNISLDLRGSYELANDIDASETIDWNGGAGFLPIRQGGTAFEGILDGKNHIINGLYINRPKEDRIGLFGNVAAGGSVKNLILTNVTVVGRYYVGGFIGYLTNSPIDNLYSSGTVTGENCVGGLVGYTDFNNPSLKLNNSNFSGNVSGQESVGGLIGANSAGIINSCFRGNVKGRLGIGGLAGCNVDNGHVINSNSQSNVTGESHVGGLCGGASDAWFKDSYFYGSVAGTDYIGGLIGDYDRCEIWNSYYNVDKVTINNGSCLTIGGLFDSQYQDWIQNDKSLKISNYAGSLVPRGDYYEISDVQGIRDLLGFAWNWTYKFRLAADLDFSNEPGLYIPYLTSEFDGNNHTISNMHLNCSFVSHLGLVGLLGRGNNYYGIVRNIGLVENEVSGCYYVGGLVGHNLGSISNSYSMGIVIGTGDYVGGLVGWNDRTISNSYSAGDVIGSGLVTGGLVGLNADTVETSFSTVEVTGNWSVGGLVGSNGYTVSDSYSSGNVTGFGSHVGGLVGVNSGELARTYSRGKVVGKDSVGGLVGTNYNDVYNSFWDKESSGKSSSSGGQGKTSAEMKTLSTFTDASWDFTKVWSIVENVTYPYFRWQDAKPPKADAGLNQTVRDRTLVTFDGGGSSDDFIIVNYTWSFIDKGPVTLSGVRPTYRFNNPGEFAVALNVTDGIGNKDTDTIIVTVNDLTLPVADAGPDQFVDEETLVVFDGAGSSDNVGIVNYSWDLIYGHFMTLYGVLSTYWFGDPGVFNVTLTVADTAGNRASDTMILTVNDRTPPVADAGTDLAVDEGSTVMFDGSASRDNAGIVNYTWEFMDGGIVRLYGVHPEYMFNHPGIFIVKLNVTDAVGYWNISNIVVIVNDITLPVADAGPNQVIPEGTVVTLDGGGSFDNVGIVNFTWTFDYGAERTFLYGISPSFKFGLPGIYSIKLNVSDAAGLWDEALMRLTVKDITPPVAQAGPDRTIPVGSKVELDGSYSSDNWGIVGFFWNFSYDGKPFSLQGMNNSFDFGIGGAYEIVLTILDRAGIAGEDRVIITVVDTGRVSGAVLDGDGKPVEGAAVEVSASDGVKSVMKTGADGSFRMEIYHGNFTWKVAKKGYLPISGSSSVKPMGEVRLDLARTPLEKEESGSLSGQPLSMVLLAALVIGVAVGTGAYAVLRRKRGGSIGKGRSVAEPTKTAPEKTADTTSKE